MFKISEHLKRPHGTEACTDLLGLPQSPSLQIPLLPQKTRPSARAQTDTQSCDCSQEGNTPFCPLLFHDMAT